MTTTCETRPREDCQDLHLRYAESRDPAVRAKLVEAYDGLVRSTARRFARRGESFDDLVQVGYVGLLQALDRFDPRRGRPFAVFAVPTIVGELKRHFRDHRWRVRVPRPLQERYLEVREARDRLVHDLARIPTGWPMPRGGAQALSENLAGLVDLHQVAGSPGLRPVCCLQRHPHVGGHLAGHRQALDPAHLGPTVLHLEDGPFVDGEPVAVGGVSRHADRSQKP